MKHPPSFFDLENHVLNDDEHKFIRSYVVTTATVYGLSVFLDLVPDEPVYAKFDV